MNKALFVLAAGLSLLPLNGCGSDNDSADPVALCKEAASTLCSKFFGCYTKDQLTKVASLVGDSEADCVAKFSGADNFNCTPEGTKCEAGQLYDGSKGRECVDDFNATSCTEITSGVVTIPAACNETCK